MTRKSAISIAITSLGAGRAGKPGPRRMADSTGRDHRNQAEGIGTVCRNRAQKSLPSKPTPAAQLGPGQSITARNTDNRRPLLKR